MTPQQAGIAYCDWLHSEEGERIITMIGRLAFLSEPAASEVLCRVWWAGAVWGELQAQVDSAKGAP